jgi:hypothetical protein
MSHLRFTVAPPCPGLLLRVGLPDRIAGGPERLIVARDGIRFHSIRRLTQHCRGHHARCPNRTYRHSRGRLRHSSETRPFGASPPRSPPPRLPPPPPYPPPPPRGPSSYPILREHLWSKHVVGGGRLRRPCGGDDRRNNQSHSPARVARFRLRPSVRTVRGVAARPDSGAAHAPAASCDPLRLPSLQLYSPPLPRRVPQPPPSLLPDAPGADASVHPGEGKFSGFAIVATTLRTRLPSQSNAAASAPSNLSPDGFSTWWHKPETTTSSAGRAACQSVQPPPPPPTTTSRAARTAPGRPKHALFKP